MRVIDCILYNGERDMLSLRLDLMGPSIDKFLIVEAPITFSGLPKELSFPADKQFFSAHLHKIDYRVVDEFPHCATAWDREYFLRDSIRRLVNADDNDILIIADADELVNFEHIRTFLSPGKSMLVELPTYYYYLNVQSTEKIRVTLVTSFGAIKDKFIGNRRLYKDFGFGLISDPSGRNGGHFTYLFGDDISKYISKMRSFSHSEYSQGHYIDPERIATCVRHNLDLLERDQYDLRIIDLGVVFPELKSVVSKRPELKRLVQHTTLKSVAQKMTHINRYLIRRLFRKSRLNAH